MAEIFGIAFYLTKLKFFSCKNMIRKYEYLKDLFIKELDQKSPF